MVGWLAKVLQIAHSVWVIFSVPPEDPRWKVGSLFENSKIEPVNLFQVEVVHDGFVLGVSFKKG
ncbi:MAG: hypothetical protein WA323_16345 [Candidatus Nitrosopolaris sp.]|jgi:hypothetical protein